MCRLARCTTCFWVATATLLTAGTARADIVYDLNLFPGFPAPWTFDSSTITTDGTLGTLSESNITDWSIRFTSPAGSHTLTPANSYFQFAGAASTLIATETGLTMETSPTGEFLLEFFSDTFLQDVLWRSSSSGGTARLEMYDLWPGGGIVSTTLASPGEQLRLSTAIPEPFTSGLLCLGTGIISLRRGRR